jgi:hypothetical protein
MVQETDPEIPMVRKFSKQGPHGSQAGGGSNYIPITVFRTSSLVQNAASAGRAIGDEVELHSRRLAETLVGDEGGEVVATLSYSIREIMRNVVEHAQTDAFAVRAIDRGRNPSDVSALLRALKRATAESA